MQCSLCSVRAPEYCGQCVSATLMDGYGQVEKIRRMKEELATALEPFLPSPSSPTSAASTRVKIQEQEGKNARLRARIQSARKANAVAKVAHSRTRRALSQRAQGVASAWDALTTLSVSSAPLLEEKIDAADEERGRTRGALAQARRELVVELVSILPLNPLDESTMSMAGIPFPSSSPIGPWEMEEEAFDAAMGYACQLLNLLARYLGVVLPYPAIPFGSKSLIAYSSVGPWLSLFRSRKEFGDDHQLDALLAGVPSLARRSADLILDPVEALALFKYNVAVLVAAAAGIPSSLTRDFHFPLANLLRALRSPYLGLSSHAFHVFPPADFERIFTTLPPLVYLQSRDKQLSFLQRLAANHVASRAIQSRSAAGSTHDASPTDDATTDDADWEFV